jgi:hypothetical protein
MRRQGKQDHTAQPWHRRYRVYLLIPIILGYFIIYGCGNPPLRRARPIKVPYEFIDDGAADEDRRDAQTRP